MSGCRGITRRWLSCGTWTLLARWCFGSSRLRCCGRASSLSAVRLSAQRANLVRCVHLLGILQAPTLHRLHELTSAVYNLSVLSSISPRDAERLVPSADSMLRLPTLFCVGVHDIAHLETRHDGGWAACTTDEILATKNKLYDIMVELPLLGISEDGDASGRRKTKRMK